MKYALLFTTCLLFASLSSCSTKKIEDQNALPQVQFATKHIADIQLKKQSHFDKIQFQLDTINLEAEAYDITVNNNEILIKGGGANGLMYGGLEVAEQIELNNTVTNTKGKPYIKKRGIKFNIPLDARTPSYDDSGDAAQENIAEMWEWSFWEAYLDDLALHRYNILSLWNPHPFPSMIKLPDYPDVALDDVFVTTLKPIGKENEWAEPQMVSSNVMENLKKVKTISIDEKIAFWKKVMQHAKDRGIEIYFFTWNVCPNSVATPVEPFYRTYDQELWEEVPGKYGITNQMNNPLNVAYYREAVKTFLLTYPDVKGIGVTAGEHMRDQLGAYNREQWIWETYGLALTDIQKLQPERKVDFIHRVWNTDVSKIMNYWKDYTGSFEASFKYAKARLYSSPYLNFADGHIERMKEFDLKSWWNLRNDDIFVYRWGDPDYVRAFIGHFQKEYTAGFYMGSDGYVWGKEFTSKNPELSGQLEIKKHWYNFMLWGRLAYNNQLDEGFFIQKLQAHFPATDANKLYTGWQAASKIIPQVNVFHWRDWDFQFSPEICIDARTGFHDIKIFMENPTMANSNIASPIQYANAITKGKTVAEITPLQVVDSLNNFADQALRAVTELASSNNTAELNTLLDDMAAMSYLGLYYAKKIEAATELALYKTNNSKAHQKKAVALLEAAILDWERYTEVSEKNYRSQMLARTAMLDWRNMLENVKKDVTLAKTITF
ncbi:MAG: hypothetical protein WBM98_14875 [Maribacter sp.]|uniref:hypothetical protein n=1 Tax=Maribacter sp. TaxID=1897614 RepID=UPI003C70D90D